MTHRPFGPFLAVAMIASACMKPAPAPRVPVVVVAPALSAAAQLNADLSKIFSVPELEHALLAVSIQGVDSGEILYAQNAAALVMPASTSKVVTLAAAVDRLGWDHRYETRLVSSAPIVNGVLKGDLIIVGAGDPSMNHHHGGPDLAFDQWAEQLRGAGIRVIQGDLVGDDRAFGQDVFGDGWAWDDLADGYAAPIGALQLRENVIKLALRPGDAAGKPITVEVPPAAVAFPVVNRAITVAAGSKGLIRARRWPGSSGVEISGQVPMGVPAFTRNAAVARPTEYFLHGLAAALRARGIELRGGTHDVRDAAAAVEASRPDLRTLATYRSPPLAELATVMMKVSHNGYAETLLRTLGRPAVEGTAATGLKVVGEVLGSWGIVSGSYVLRDGSGLSRLNYLTTDIMVAVLRHLYGDPRHRDRFLATLPIAGRDGTLKDRMVGTPMEGKVRAKTGTVSNVRALAGYVETSDGETIAFAFIANNFRIPLPAVDAVIEAALRRLVTFSRRPVSAPPRSLAP